MSEKYNVINTSWGTIVEHLLEKDKASSIATIVFDSGQSKPPEYHKKSTERFVGLYGVGYINFLSKTTEITPGVEVTVKPMQVYSLGANTGNHFALKVTVTPPFDPNDQFEA